MFNKYMGRKKSTSLTSIAVGNRCEAPLFYHNLFHLLSSYYELGTVLSTSHASSSKLTGIMTVPLGRHYSHSTDEETKAQDYIARTDSGA